MSIPVDIQNITTESFGRDGGDHVFPPVGIRTISIWSGATLDAIVLNGTRHGGTGGKNRGTLSLASGEYIDTIEIRHGRRVDYLKITTTAGNTIHGGDPKGGTSSTYHGKVLALGGKSGDEVDHINIIGVRST